MSAYCTVCGECYDTTTHSCLPEVQFVPMGMGPKEDYNVIRLSDAGKVYTAEAQEILAKLDEILALLKEKGKP